MTNSLNFDIIVIGGGPVGIATGIELGLHGVKTLVLEKHDAPLMLPRAQSLSARTMELFLKWGVDKTLEDNLLLPKSLPQTGVWCDNLHGKAFLDTAWGDNELAENVSAKAGVRVPIWVTEAVLRNRLKELSSVTFLKEHEVSSIIDNDEDFSINVISKKNNKHLNFSGKYLCCCDGVSGITKKHFNNPYTPLSNATKMLGVLFTAPDLMKSKSVADGIMYFVLQQESLAFVGPVDLDKGLWLAQIVWPNDLENPNESDVSKLINKVIGKTTSHHVNDFYFWDMQVQMAQFANLNNRVFWLGDSVHAFAPTGGLGLNTGFGDPANLCWKLAEVIKGNASASILETYEQERFPVWQSNLNFAKNNAEEFLAMKEKYPPEKDYQAYMNAYANLGNRYLKSSGLTLGYGYLDSPLIRNISNQTLETNPFCYQPKVEPGYFLPNINLDGQSIYQKLSANQWNLITCGDLSDLNDFSSLHVLKIKEGLYPYSHILLRPDWHIANVSQKLTEIKPFY